MAKRRYVMTYESYVASLNEEDRRVAGTGSGPSSQSDEDAFIVTYKPEDSDTGSENDPTWTIYCFKPEEGEDQPTIYRVEDAKTGAEIPESVWGVGQMDDLYAAVEDAWSYENSGGGPGPMGLQHESAAPGMTPYAASGTTRSLSEIAQEIYADWKNVNYAAKPYLEAMSDLDSIDDMYMQDSARTIVSYFLSNAGSWKGDVASRVKAELKAMVASKRK